MSGNSANGATAPGWQVIGRVAVDSGHIVITDPCNAAEAARAWDAYAENPVGEPPAVQSPPGPDGNVNQLAVFAGTGFGDGYFEVEARYAGDRIAELRMVFIGEDEAGLYARGWSHADGTEVRLPPPGPA
jgi:hypothetical protein